MSPGSHPSYEPSVLWLAGELKFFCEAPSIFGSLLEHKVSFAFFQVPVEMS